MKCGKTKTKADFSQRPETKRGYRYECKECQYQPTKLKCKTCKEEKPTSSFTVEKRNATGYRKECKKCRRKPKANY